MGLDMLRWWLDIMVVVEPGVDAWWWLDVIVVVDVSRLLLKLIKINKKIIFKEKKNLGGFTIIIIIVIV